jgi:hypothetical protein
VYGQFSDGRFSAGGLSTIMETGSGVQGLKERFNTLAKAY